ncbi:hypothetical protein SAMN04487765_1357 [Tenacibaculum sp. MAR_2010_89]|uniref:hypothetical protein n=1 Tax=Tenacibaculum sp. MAR_2010_89 TaxID=1250198 RepID=UPI00089CCA4A|nr:hypothetical protein [Tenacibaculum sp. MAR_2010_89]SEE08981.1 hypothetical protein SAMN04487765_1357 [Tenacibaculum sp. MAR_2010_89]
MSKQKIEVANKIKSLIDELNVELKKAKENNLIIDIELPYPTVGRNDINYDIYEKVNY